MSEEIDEKQLEAIFYTNYRSWEEKFKEWISEKTDRKLVIMEPVFFSFDKDVDEHSDFTTKGDKE